MLDTLTIGNMQDFQQRYSGTYGWLLQENKKLLVLVGDVEKGRLQFTDIKKGFYYAEPDAGVMFEFIPVDRGFFPAADGNVYFLERTPAKQYHRGIHTANTKVYVLSAGGLVALRLSIKILNDIFVDPPKFSQDNIVLSKHFAISEDVVYFYNRIIGSFHKGRVDLSIHHVNQELCDAIRRSGFNYEVVNV